MKNLKIALVHEWFVDYSGSERVVEQMLNVFPQADLFAVVDFLPSYNREFIKNKTVKTTFIQKLPFSKTKYRNYLPLMPLAIEQIDLSAYDLVISSSHAVAKGIITSPHQVHLCMCYSPIRYAWDLQHQYLRESNLDKGFKGALTKAILHYIRLWDVRTAHGVDKFIAISKFIQKRIKKVYGREATVIYPPVDVDSFTLEENKEDFYLTVSRMVPYKKIDLIAEAFTEMGTKKLVIIGDGTDFQKIKAKAGKNVELLGYRDFKTVKDYMQRAKAFLFAAEEDFGIAPVEAQACGTPVIAYGRGGALETICALDSENPTGIFFKEQNTTSLIEAVTLFEQNITTIKPNSCRNNAIRFNPERFRNEFTAFVSNSI